MKVFILIIIIHWIADFVFQHEKWALGKSKSIKPLLSHTITYSIIWIIPVFLMTKDVVGSLLFTLVAFLAHTFTDYFTSKVVSSLFAKKKLGISIPNFGAFSVIGFDQVLHYIQLVLTWYIIFGVFW